MDRAHMITVGAVAVVVILLACAAITMNNGNDDRSDDTPIVTPIPPSDDTGDGDHRILVAYFSKTGTTERYARTIAQDANADLFEIETVNPYPSDYQTTTEVARAELDSNARPELSTHVDNMEDYDVIIIGFPIWWHAPPMAVLSFLEEYDLDGKTIVTFCTSGSSPISETTDYVEGSSGDATVIEGLRMTSSTDIPGWLDALGITSE